MSIVNNDMSSFFSKQHNNYSVLLGWICVTMSCHAIVGHASLMEYIWGMFWMEFENQIGRGKLLELHNKGILTLNLNT